MIVSSGGWMPVSVYWGVDDGCILCIGMRSCLSMIGYWRIVCNTMRRPRSRLNINIVVIINQTVGRGHSISAKGKRARARARDRQTKRAY